MNNWARRLVALACLAWLLPPAARAQDADPAVWGVYARLPGVKLVSDKGKASTPYLWYWNADKTALVEDRGEIWGSSEIKPLGNGKLARLVKGSHLWTGVVQADGTVVWDAEGNFLTRVAGEPYRVRREGDALLLEYVSLTRDQVTEAWPMSRLIGFPPSPAPAVAASPADTASAPAVVALAGVAAEEAASADEKTGPRALSAQDLAKLRAGMARDKLQRAESLRRQQEEAVRQAEMRRQQAEYDARMAAQRAAEEREEERASSDAFAGALMSGLNVFKDEMAKNQAQQAQQQAFLANLQRQQQQAADARQREQDRQRQAAAQEQLYRQQQAAAQQQQRQAAPSGNAGGNSNAAQAQAQAQAAQAERKAKADAAERELRERAAAERQRQQEVREQRLAEERASARTSEGFLTIAETPKTPLPISPPPPAPPRPAAPTTTEPVMGFLGRTCGDAIAGAQRFVGTSGTFKIKQQDIQPSGNCIVQIHHWKSSPGGSSIQ